VVDWKPSASFCRSALTTISDSVCPSWAFASPTQTDERHAAPVIDAHNLKLTPFPNVTDLMRMLMRTIRNKEAGAVYVKPESGE
jgi:hypothetical protein